MRKVAFFDLDGTLWKSGIPIESAVSCANFLKENGVETYFITNNSTATIDEFVSRIQNINVKCEAHDVLNTGVATALYCKDLNMHSAYVVGEDGLKQTFQDFGISENMDQPEAVIVGLKRDVTYDELRLAMKFILNGAKFIATNTDAQYPTNDGLTPGAGSIVAFVQTATKTTPIVIGKPNKPILEVAFERYQLTDNDLVIMIGDNYDTDIYGGIDYGIQTIHVEGGVHTSEYVMKQEKTPTITVPTLEDERVKALFQL